MISTQTNIYDRNRDESKAIEIYNLYYKTMLYTARSILNDYALAEDAVSESFIKILNNLHKINEIDSYPTRNFIIIIVKNTSRDLLRKQNRLAVQSIDDYLELNETKAAHDILKDITIKEACSVITSCIFKLQDNYADILYLKIEMDYSLEEISKLLNISYGNAKMRFSRARKALISELSKTGYYNEEL